MEVIVEIEDIDGLGAWIEEAAALPDTPEARQAVVDGAHKVAKHILEELDRMIYSQPLSKSGYKRTTRLMKGTMATGKAVKEGKALVSAVQSIEEYAQHVEFGTENAAGETLMPARPFMRSGADKSLKDLIEVLSDFLQSSLK